EQPRGMAHVALRVDDPDERACIALPLLGLLDTAERAPRRQTGVVCRQTLSPEVVFEKREVRAHFTRELLLGVPIEEQCRKPPPESSPRSHQQAYSHRRATSGSTDIARRAGT